MITREKWCGKDITRAEEDKVNINEGGRRDYRGRVGVEVDQACWSL